MARIPQSTIVEASRLLYGDESRYHRRLASYQLRHPGATRQEARGHKPPPGRTEAAVRRERALQRHGISPRRLTERYRIQKGLPTEADRRFVQRMEKIWADQLGSERANQLKAAFLAMSPQERQAIREQRKRYMGLKKESVPLGRTSREGRPGSRAAYYRRLPEGTQAFFWYH